MPTERSCGECEACCTILGVAEIGKNPWQPCNHQGKGCTIYPTRPETCQKFQCIWLWDQEAKLMQEKDRPDKCGVMCVAGSTDSAFFKETQIPVMVLYECVPGAFEMYHGDRLVRRLRSKHVMALLPYGTQSQKGDPRRMVGPPRLMRGINAWLAAKGKL